MKLPQLYDIFRERWEQYSDCFIISDTHFDDDELYIGTKHIIRANSDEYVKLINSKCGKNSLLLHLGDVGAIEPISKIRAAHKVLIMGNHDAGASNYKRKIIKQIFDADKYDKKEIVSILRSTYPACRISISDLMYDTQHAPFKYYTAFIDNNLFDEVYEGPLVIGEKLILSHEPIDVTGMFNLHGHTHAATHKNDNTHFNCCSDYIGYIPINFNQWMKQGYLSKVQTLHRKVIDKASLNKHGQKRLKKKK